MLRGAVFLLALVASVSTGWADSESDCFESTDSDVMIAGCTAVINSSVTDKQGACGLAQPVEMPLRVSSTRSLGAYTNVFAIESFMDELARAKGLDPLQYRLRYLKDQRARDVLTRCAQKFGWSTYQRKDHRGRGIAFGRYKNFAAFVAVAVEVEVSPRNGRTHVVRAVAANDSGLIINPDGIANQIQGGLIQSLSWTLKEEVKFDATGVRSTDWKSYPIITFTEVPHVDVVLIDRPGEPYLGTGEAAQGPTSAAVANAVLDAVGARLRRLPFTPDRVKAEMDRRA